MWRIVGMYRRVTFRGDHNGHIILGWIYVQSVYMEVGIVQIVWDIDLFVQLHVCKLLIYQ